MADGFNYLIDFAELIARAISLYNGYISKYFQPVGIMQVRPLVMNPLPCKR